MWKIWSPRIIRLNHLAVQATSASRATALTNRSFTHLLFSKTNRSFQSVRCFISCSKFEASGRKTRWSQFFRHHFDLQCWRFRWLFLAYPEIWINKQYHFWSKVIPKIPNVYEQKRSFPCQAQFQPSTRKIHLWLCSLYFLKSILNQRATDVNLLRSNLL